MKAIMLRRATQADADMLFAWRNDPSTFEQFRTAKPVTKAEHERWMKFSVEQGYPTHLVFIAETDTGTTGIIRFDADKFDVMSYWVSITVAPDMRRKGLGQQMLDYGCGYMEEYTLFAEIKYKNRASIIIFERAGFQQHDDDGEFLIYKRGPTA